MHVNSTPYAPTTTVENERVPPPTAPGDAEVDIELLKSVPDKFAVVDEQTANWVIKRIQSARAYGARVEAWGQQELRRAEREEQTLMFLFGRQLQDWAKAQIEKLNGQRKSLNLPAGCIGFRKVNSKLVIDDDQVVLLWAKANCPRAVLVVERLSKSVIDEYVETKGVIPDEGVHVEPESERFYVR